MENRRQRRTQSEWTMHRRSMNRRRKDRGGKTKMSSETETGYYCYGLSIKMTIQTIHRKVAMQKRWLLTNVSR